MFMHAIVRTGGKQYLVKVGDIILVEKLEVEVGAQVALEALATVSETEATLGAPALKTTVTAKVIEQDRHDKVTGIKFHPKKRYMMKFGHRQHYTKLEILSV